MQKEYLILYEISKQITMLLLLRLMTFSGYRKIEKTIIVETCVFRPPTVHLSSSIAMFI